MLGKLAETPQPSRRQFLKAGAAAGVGLVIGFHVPVKAVKGATLAKEDFTPNAFVRIAPDSSVTVISKHIEFGQGSYTGLATIVAEELDASWEQIRVEAAPSDPKVFNNLNWGPFQGTGGSSTIANSFDQLRQAGAAARAMLVAAAAQAWGVPARDIAVENGVVSHAASGRQASFGDLAERAATLEPPQEVVLKNPRDFKLIGTSPQRTDSRAKSRGEAKFTIDMRLPGMLTAVIARPPRFGGKAKSFDATAAKAVKGVTDVVEIPRGVAVLAESFWAAKTGRDALVITWDESQAETRSSDQIMAEYKELAKKPGTIARQDGDAAAAMASAAKVLEADFEYPYLAHAPMEPLDCVVRLSTDGCEIWTGSQLPTVDHLTAAAITGLPQEMIKIHTLLTGGSFGRRATPDSDMVSEAVAVAKAIDGRAPVKVIWTREDDIQGGRYRPMYYHTIRGGLDDNGNIVGWEHRIVGQSIVQGTPFEGGLVKNGVDQTSVEGANNLPYAIPNVSVDLHSPSLSVPVLWWRAVGSTHTAYTVETFIDELAFAAGKDPVEFRMAMLANHPRHRAVLELAAEKAGWGTALTQGKGRGIAVHESFDSFVAQTAEVSIGEDGQVKVDRVVCAVDCGLPVNPDVIRAQMEGGIGYGLGAILHDAITLDEGRVAQSNFHDYLPLRIEEMPKIEVHIVPSTAAPTGVGEPGTPPVGPAVANAVFAATGRRIRSLPFALHDLGSA